MIEKMYKAGIPVFWVRTSEYNRAENEIKSIIGAPAYHWDAYIGGPIKDEDTLMGSQDPLDTITAFLDVQGKAILFLWNFHHYISSPDIIAAILDALPELQSTQKAIFILTPSNSIPVELLPYIHVIDFELPNKDKIETFVKSFDPQIKNADQIAEAGLGLTKFEFMAAMATSKEVYGQVDTRAIMEKKAQLIKKNSVLELYVPQETDSFRFIGGLDNLKQFLLKVTPSPLSKGVLLVGVPGTGKSAIAKALGVELGLPVTRLDFGRVFNSLVGESETRMIEALRVIDAMGGILFIDEIEKAIGGVASSHLTDGGTGARVFGTFLQWMQDHTSNVFVIATSNDIEKLPPEFTRSGRWDAIFFVDIPTPAERKSIWKIWTEYYGVEPRIPNDDNWTGAEIATACRIAKMFDSTPKDVAQYITPIARTMKEKIAKLREWAEGRTIPASKVIRQRFTATSKWV